VSFVAQVMLRKAGVDDALSRHVAHLFIRDPLVIFDDSLDVDDQRSTEHFENIQSTNWQTVSAHMSRIASIHASLVPQ
jgi:hypothetical protein